MLPEGTHSVLVVAEEPGGRGRMGLAEAVLDGCLRLQVGGGPARGRGVARGAAALFR